MNRESLERLWVDAGSDPMQFARAVAEVCASLAEKDPGDPTWLGRASRDAAAARIRFSFKLNQTE